MLRGTAVLTFDARQAQNVRKKSLDLVAVGPQLPERCQAGQLGREPLQLVVCHVETL